MSGAAARVRGLVRAVANGRRLLTQIADAAPCSPTATTRTAAVARPSPATAAAADAAWRAPQLAACGLRWFATSSFSSSSDVAAGSSSGGDSIAPSSGGGSSGGGGNVTSGGLQESMDKLVDTAVQLVESGRLGQAITVLQHGIEALQQAFPGSPELSELHNQVALLALFADKADDAATHAEAALTITSDHFGAAHPLTAHRLLRLGTIRAAQGRPGDAAPLLATAADSLLRPGVDDAAGAAEARFHLAVLRLGGGGEGASSSSSTSAPDVAAVDGDLREALRALLRHLGPESMVVRIALAAHGRAVGAGLDAATAGGGFELGEALFKQHIRLQELQDPDSAELGLSCYQLAVTYYAHDMLVDAAGALTRATAALRRHYPEEHDLVALCRHRAGMMAAAGRDARAAAKLLGESAARYGAAQEGHPLQREAQLGLAMAEFKSLDARLGADARREQQRALLASMQAAAGDMARALGAEHLLVSGAARYIAQLSVLSGLHPLSP